MIDKAHHKLGVRFDAIDVLIRTKDTTISKWMRKMLLDYMNTIESRPT